MQLKKKDMQSYRQKTAPVSGAKTGAGTDPGLPIAKDLSVSDRTDRGRRAGRLIKPSVFC